VAALKKAVITKVVMAAEAVAVAIVIVAATTATINSKKYSLHSTSLVLQPDFFIFIKNLL
jgi:hypothetical protein